MATNKHAYIRYKVLDKCFGNPGRRYFIENLIEECEKILMDIDPASRGISRRQVLADIAFMESGDGWGLNLFGTMKVDGSIIAMLTHRSPSTTSHSMNWS